MASALEAALLISSMPEGPATMARTQYDATATQHENIAKYFISIINGTIRFDLDQKHPLEEIPVAGVFSNKAWLTMK
jgi:hypothetical protein